MLPPNAWLIGFWLQLLATGAYCSYIPQCVSILLARIREGSRWLPGVCAVFFVITMTVLGADIALAYQAHAVRGIDEFPDPFAVYANIASVPSLIKGGGLVGSALLSDCVMVYRTFVVWELRAVVIIVPVLLLLVDVGLGVLSAWTLFHTGILVTPITSDVVLRARYFAMLTLAVNVICAGLICWKIRHVNSQVRFSGMRDGALSRAFEVIIQTAALYCLYLLVFIITNIAHSNIFFALINALPPITALVFTMLLVRISQSRHGESPTTITWHSIRFRSHAQTGEGNTTVAHIDLERVVIPVLPSAGPAGIDTCEDGLSRGNRDGSDKASLTNVGGG
ncbi:hypothetical protein C8Q76DRAFT_115033 [Earliella scabrosa]|nr:hypothetical protein C8Q76DRAFT_115033 [Earliella scabrosa]